MKNGSTFKIVEDDGYHMTIASKGARYFLSAGPAIACHHYTVLDVRTAEGRCFPHEIDAFMVDWGQPRRPRIGWVFLLACVPGATPFAFDGGWIAPPEEILAEAIEAYLAGPGAAHLGMLRDPSNCVR